MQFSSGGWDDVVQMRRLHLQPDGSLDLVPVVGNGKTLEFCAECGTEHSGGQCSGIQIQPSGCCWIEQVMRHSTLRPHKNCRKIW